jgi:hypothetical protein
MLIMSVSIHAHMHSSMIQVRIPYSCFVPTPYHATTTQFSPSNAETAGKPLTKKEDQEEKNPGKKRLRIGRIKR